jgi:hypothetical protein
MGSGAPLAERIDFGHCALAAKTPLNGPLRGPCFAAGTLVSTSEGEKPIEEVKEGDSVFAYDFASAKVVEKTVTKLNWGETRCWIHVGVDTGDEIKATRFHPFWVENRKVWVEALDLEPGMVLRLKSGAVARVHGVRAEILDEPEATFNFEVADVHNYFVASGVLVHNGGPTPPTPHQLLGLPDPLPLGSAYELAQKFQLNGAKAGRAALQSQGLWGRGFQLHIPTQMQDLTLPNNQPHIHGFDGRGKEWGLNINGTSHHPEMLKGKVPENVKAALRGAGWGC